MNWHQLHPLFRERLTILVELLKESELEMHATSGYRTAAEQDALYAQGRTKPGPKVTKARAGQSAHNWGCACDFCFDGPKPYVGDWLGFVNLVALAGLRSGTSWGDGPHVELPEWKKVRAQGWHPPA